jgi:Inovirus Coat protein B
MFNSKNAVKRLALGAGLALVAVTDAFAVGPAAPDLSSLTPDFTTVTTAMTAIAGAVAIVYVTWKGIKLVLRAIKGG